MCIDVYHWTYMYMARKKRGEVKRLPIELDLDDPAQRRVWEHWLELSERGEASRWARDVLIAATPAKAKGPPRVGGWMGKPGVVKVDNNHSDEPHYEPVED